MISKTKSNHSLIATLNYNLKEGSEIFFQQNLSGETIADHRLQFEDLHCLYRGTAKSLILHAIVSPEISEGQKLKIEEWKDIATKFLNGLGLEEHQAIGFRHEDKGHAHIHLIINRINENDFSLFNDSFISKRGQKVSDEIAQQMGLTRAKEIFEARKKREKEVGLGVAQPSSEKPIGSKQIFKAFLEKMSSQPHKDILSYLKAIESEGYQVKLHKNKENGQLRGYGIAKDGTYMDASAIDKKFTIKNLSFDINTQSVVEENRKATPKMALPESKPTERRRGPRL